MTKHEIHRRALLTAAKLSLFAAGCSATDGAIAGTQSTTAPTSTSTTQPVDVPPPAPEPTPAKVAPGTAVLPFTPADPGAKKGCQLPVYSLPTDKDIACCDAEISAAYGEDGAALAAPDGATPTGLVACCAVAIDYYDKHGADAAAAGHTLPWNVRQSCCSVVHPAPIGPTCTPWGPPAPPAMPVGWA